MKKIFTAFLISCMFCGVAQTQNGTFKILTGTIDAYAVKMLLYQQGHNYKGYYYYASMQKPIYFSGSDAEAKDSISLITSGADKEEYFKLSKDSAANGTWKRGQKGNILKVALAEDSSSSLLFNYRSIKDSVLLRKGMRNSPMAIFEASSVWPVGTDLPANFIKAQIKKFFDIKQPATNLYSLLENKKRSFFDDYIKGSKDAKAADIKETPSLYSYDASYDLLINFETEKIISFAFAAYSYTGGAHGNYSTSYLSVDINTNKIIHLKDIMNTAGISKLQPLLEKAFRKQFQLKPDDSLTKGGLFENKLTPNNNFYITEKGIAFIYNPYEIGPYAMGEIELFISFKEIEKYLQPHFKKLISVQGNG